MDNLIASLRKKEMSPSSLFTARRRQLFQRKRRFRLISKKESFFSSKLDNPFQIQSQRLYIVFFGKKDKIRSRLVVIKVAAMLNTSVSRYEERVRMTRV